jgi:antibiotic biosynthesis monooxygenase (ABM) superfamily enzyme
VIVRLLRARIAPNRTPEFHEFIQRVGLPALRATAGLLDVHVGRRSVGTHEEAVVVSVWRDWDSLTAVIDDPQQPYLLTAETGLVVETSVEHYEAVETEEMVPPATPRLG